eukprot:765880-Pelagomonas_calceolata.AAC.2
MDYAGEARHHPLLLNFIRSTSNSCSYLKSVEHITAGLRIPVGKNVCMMGWGSSAQPKEVSQSEVLALFPPCFNPIPHDSSGHHTSTIHPASSIPYGNAILLVVAKSNLQSSHLCSMTTLSQGDRKHQHTFINQKGLQGGWPTARDSS